MAIATRLQNPNTMANTVGYEGFSWTCLFFGPFPAIFRGDFIGFAAMAISALVTFGLSGLLWMFAYNRWHYNRLLAQGFQPAGFVSLSNNITINNGFENHTAPLGGGAARFVPERAAPAMAVNGGGRTVGAGFGKRSY